MPESVTATEAAREGTIRSKLPPEIRELLDAAQTDPGAPFESAAVAMLLQLRAEDPAGWQRARSMLKTVDGVTIAALERLTAPAGTDDGDGRATQAGDLIAAAENCVLFHDGEDAFADIECDGHRETWAVRSRGFRLWLQYRYFEAHGGAPNSEALRSALGTIEARARFRGEHAPVFRRVASTGDRLYLDMGNRAWQAIEVDSSGWRVVDRPPLRFVRSRTLRELPSPKRGASIGSLRSFLNLSDEDFTLAVAWLLAALRSDGPYPALVLTGEQGSAKSMCARLLSSLVDPQDAPLRSAPRDERDLFIMARNVHVLAFDNLSVVPAWLSDALCRISTGGGFASRQLYTDSDEVVIDAVRPIILNGIDAVVARGDLADRAIFLTLGAIPDADRRPESEILARFEAEKPGILGVLLDAIATGMRRLADVRLDRLPRMADFAKWAVACEPALFEAGAFMKAYTDNRAEAVSSVIDASPVASAIRELMRSRSAPWEGTPSELYGELSGIAGERVTAAKGWPTNAQALGRSLNQISSALRPTGLIIAKARNNKRRLICISKRTDSPRQNASLLSPAVTGAPFPPPVTEGDTNDGILQPLSESRTAEGDAFAALPLRPPSTPTTCDAYRKARDGE